MLFDDFFAYFVLTLLELMQSKQKNHQKAGIFEGSFFWGGVNLTPLHIS